MRCQQATEVPDNGLEIWYRYCLILTQGTVDNHCSDTTHLRVSKVGLLDYTQRAFVFIIEAHEQHRI